MSASEQEHGDEQQRDDEAGQEPAAPRVTFMTVLASTLAAAIGVQSKENKERDFQHGSAAPFIAAGIIFTVLFVVVLVIVVRLVLSSVG